MKALTLTQPWATLAAIGAKRIETRSWSTYYTGPLAIHAAKGFPKYAKDQCLCAPFAKVLKAAGFTTIFDKGWEKLWPNLSPLPLGAVIATCQLTFCIKIEKHRPSYGSRSEVNGNHINFIMAEFPVPPDEPELSFGDYSPGRYAWILEDIKKLPDPIPAKGALGLWDWNSNELEG